MKKKILSIVLSFVIAIRVVAPYDSFINANDNENVLVCVNCDSEDVVCLSCKQCSDCNWEKFGATHCPECKLCYLCEADFDIPHCSGCDWGRDCLAVADIGWCEDCYNCEVCCFKSNCDGGFYYWYCAVCGEFWKRCDNKGNCDCENTGISWRECFCGFCFNYCVDCGGNFSNDECICNITEYWFCAVCGDFGEDCDNHGYCPCPDSGELWYDCYCDFCSLYCTSCGGNLSEDNCTCGEYGEWFCSVCGEFWGDCINYGYCPCPDSDKIWYNCYCDLCSLYCTLCGGNLSENMCACDGYWFCPVCSEFWRNCDNLGYCPCPDSGELWNDCYCDFCFVYCVLCGEPYATCDCGEYYEDGLCISVVEIDGNNVIEISNLTDEAISTKGLYLSDNEEDLYKWQMPVIILQAGETILISGDENDITSVMKRTQTNFNVLLAEELFLTGADEVILNIW